MNVTPFLMFEGRCEEAMNFYISLFPGATVDMISRYGPGMPGREGSVLQARFTVAGQAIMAIDSHVHHAFTFTPAFSLFVNCDSEEELDGIFAKLSDGGSVLMPVANYGFSRKFGWTNDRYGVSWQINLP
ncbi:MAG: VOC family protein [Alphaproteobacteria bacterium]|nr:VOC family protein [Alphaproteobacteria bacterium]